MGVSENMCFIANVSNGNENTRSRLRWVARGGEKRGGRGAIRTHHHPDALYRAVFIIMFY